MAAGVAAEALENLTSSLSLLVNSGKAILDNAKHDAAASLEGFVPDKISTMFGLITVAADFYNSIGVTSKADAESTWAKSYHHVSVRNEVENLLQLESQWNSFLAGVDAELCPVETQGPEGSCTPDRLSGDVALVDARTTDHVSVRNEVENLLQLEALENLTSSLSLLVNSGKAILDNAKHDAADRLSGDVALIYRAFGLGSSYAHVLKFDFLLQAAKYQIAGPSLEGFVPDKINSMFGLITVAADFYNSIGVTSKADAESTWAKSYHHVSVRNEVENLLQLEIYRAFGLGLSYANVLKFDFLLQAAKDQIAGRDSPDIPRQLLGNVYQMGGDFVLDKEGKVCLCHPSQHPMDRPAMADLLA
ncbi:hypothetical protein CRUP_038118, partial [Coryphaenoides rupestris]